MVTDRTPSRGPVRARRPAFALLDVLVAGIILGSALVVIIGIGNRSLRAQIQGEQLQRAASILDELLADVLMNGPDGYEKRFPTDGWLDSPYDDYEYEIAISDQGAGRPYIVTATIWWDEGRLRESVETWMAPRLGDDPDPDRAPEERVERQ